ncbi:MAG: class I SAM-dependent methyltransferase [Clostridiales bacterium]|nr:class I SAM-dependent methyltransferase [Clostridiales bacterium]
MIEKDKKNILYNKRFPRSNNYSADWVINKSMGPNALWLTEWLCEEMNLKPNMKVLDLGSGRAISSIFIAKEFGVKVWSYDLWMNPNENWEMVKERELEDSIFPIQGDARQLPFAEGFFDAIICVDSYIYFGTDDLYLDYIQKYLAPKGEIGIVVPGLAKEFDDDVPEHLNDFWGQDCWTWHTVDWWQHLWTRTGLVDIIKADLLEDGCQHYLQWKQARKSAGKDPWPKDIAVLKEDQGEFICFIRQIAEIRSKNA